MDSSKSSYRETEHEQTLYDTTVNEESKDESLQEEQHAKSASDRPSDNETEVSDSKHTTGTETN